jgi:hypothetical protein
MASVARTTKTISRLFLRRIRRFTRRSLVAFGHKSAPHARLIELERWSGYATIAILAGIFVDIWIALKFISGPREKVSSLIANGLIGLGLIAVYIVVGKTMAASREEQRLSRDKDRVSNEKVDEANARAAEAELKLARFRSEVIEKASLVDASLVATAEAVKANAMAHKATLDTMETLAKMLDQLAKMLDTLEKTLPR